MYPTGMDTIAGLSSGLRSSRIFVLTPPPRGNYPHLRLPAWLKAVDTDRAKRDMPALLIQIFACARATAAISRPGLKFAFFSIIEDVPTVPTLGDTCRINPDFADPRPVTLTSAEYPNGPSVGKRRKVKEA